MFAIGTSYSLHLSLSLSLSLPPIFPFPLSLLKLQEGHAYCCGIEGRRAILLAAQAHSGDGDIAPLNGDAGIGLGEDGKNDL